MLRLSALYRYPLKSGKGETLQQVSLDKLGLDGDRRWMLVDEASGRFLTQRAVRADESAVGVVECRRWLDPLCAGPLTDRYRLALQRRGTAWRDHLARYVACTGCR